MKIKNFNKNEQGQSLVELAVSFLILMFILGGVVDIGRMAFYYIALRDSAQEGASYASIFPYNNNEIFERIKAGIVDTTDIDIYIKYYTSDGEIEYSCTPDDCPVIDSTLDTDCLDVSNVIEVTVVDPHFEITMPLFGMIIGNETNEIVMHTSVRDVIVRAPTQGAHCNP
jgi:hypothetical protein